MAFTEERRAFSDFRAGLERDKTLREEYELAIASVVRDYNTSIYENRFVTGGAVELFTLWAMRATGVEASVVGSQLPGADIQLPKGGRLSVKFVFADRPGDIRLINVQGLSAAALWNHATLFIVASRGLHYADPDLLRNATRRTSDAVVIRWRDSQPSQPRTRGITPRSPSRRSLTSPLRARSPVVLWRSRL